MSAEENRKYLISEGFFYDGNSDKFIKRLTNFHDSDISKGIATVIKLPWFHWKDAPLEELQEHINISVDEARVGVLRINEVDKKRTASNQIKCVIWSREHVAWWMPNSNGYTPDMEKAGRYTWQQATKIVEGANLVEHNEDMMIAPEHHGQYLCEALMDSTTFYF